MSVFGCDVDNCYANSKSREERITMLTKTFRLSPYSTFGTLFQKVCLYWGIMKDDFTLYQIDDDTGKFINLMEIEESRILKYLEQYAQTSKKGKSAEAKDKSKKKKKNAKEDDAEKLFAKFYIGRIEKAPEKQGTNANNSIVLNFDLDFSEVTNAVI